MHLPGAMTPKMAHPTICLCVIHYINYINLNVGKGMHIQGALVSKSMPPAAEMCTQVAGCTLNFEHCCFPLPFCEPLISQARGMGAAYATRSFIFSENYIPNGFRCKF